MDPQADFVCVSTCSTQVNFYHDFSFIFAMLALGFRFTELSWNHGPHKWEIYSPTKSNQWTKRSEKTASTRDNCMNFFVVVFFCFCDGKLCAKAITTEDYSSRSLNCHRNLTRGHLAHNVPYWNKTNSLERGKVILKQLANG